MEWVMRFELYGGFRRLAAAGILAIVIALAPTSGAQGGIATADLPVYDPEPGQAGDAFLYPRIASDIASVDGKKVDIGSNTWQLFEDGNLVSWGPAPHKFVVGEEGLRLYSYYKYDSALLSPGRHTIGVRWVMAGAKELAPKIVTEEGNIKIIRNSGNIKRTDQIMELSLDVEPNAIYMVVHLPGKSLYAGRYVPVIVKDACSAKEYAWKTRTEEEWIGNWEECMMKGTVVAAAPLNEMLHVGLTLAEAIQQ